MDLRPPADPLNMFQKFGTAGLCWYFTSFYHKICLKNTTNCRSYFISPFSIDNWYRSVLKTIPIKNEGFISVGWG